MSYNPQTDIVVSYEREITEYHLNSTASNSYYQLINKSFKDYYKGSTVNSIAEKAVTNLKDQQLRFVEGCKTDSGEISYKEIKDSKVIGAYIKFNLNQHVQQKISLRKEVGSTVSQEDYISALETYVKTYIESGQGRYDAVATINNAKSYLQNRQLTLCMDRNPIIQPLNNEQIKEFISKVYEERFNILSQNRTKVGRVA